MSDPIYSVRLLNKEERSALQLLGIPNGCRSCCFELNHGECHDDDMEALFGITSKECSEILVHLRQKNLAVDFYYAKEES